MKIAIAADNNNPDMTRQLGLLLAENSEILGIVGPFSSDASLVAGYDAAQALIAAMEKNPTREGIQQA